MAFGREKRNAAIFVDGSNLWATSRALRWDVDFKKIITFYKTKYELLRAYYYTAVPPEGDNNIRPLVDYLDYNGWTVVQKPTKIFNNDGVSKVKGNMDNEIAVDIMKLAFKGRIDEVVLFSGDGDFKYLINAVKEEGVKVNIVSSMVMKPPAIADELRRSADEFVELDDYRDRWLRERRDA
jgi:uncharacterized LabA/DUF88 family protein